MKPASSIKKKMMSNGKSRSPLASQRTIPQSPQFHTSRRVLAQEQQFEQATTEASNPKRQKVETEKPRGLVLTQPKGFSFQTDSRLKRDVVPPTSAQLSSTQKIATSRAEPSITEPKPFRFLSDTRIKGVAESSDERDIYDESVQMKARSFQLRTFEEPVSRDAPKEPTKASSPALTTRQRSQFRPQSTVLPTQEQKEIEALSVPKFKARPLDKRVFDYGGSLGLKKVQKVTPTVPVAVNFATNQRLGEARTTSRFAATQSAKKPAIPSRSMATSAITKSVPPKATLKRKRDHELTAPQSPLFATKNRLNGGTSTVTKGDAPAKQFKARPMPSFSNPMKPVTAIQVTNPEPFAFKTQVRGQTSAQILAERLQKEQEELQRLRQFKAHAVPNFSEQTVHDSHDTVFHSSLFLVFFSSRCPDIPHSRIANERVLEFLLTIFAFQLENDWNQNARKRVDKPCSLFSAHRGPW